eukprot:TRINITY_DN235_c0_g1_i2.p1 TRINITY_DN235_c0_g1~~TRINITY_DN235_c0_g1_i2.p1  ORF type:complete len:239 (+),score=39.13 TRINITY_DN235_c0_g1_i2:38-718(+)
MPARVLDLLLLVLVVSLVLPAECQYEFLMRNSDSFHSNSRMSKAGGKAGELLRAVQNRPVPTSPQGLSENQDNQLRSVLEGAKDIQAMQQAASDRTAAQGESAVTTMSHNQRKAEKKRAEFKSRLAVMGYKQRHLATQHPMSLYAFGSTPKPSLAQRAAIAQQRSHIKEKQFVYNAQEVQQRNIKQRLQEEMHQQKVNKRTNKQQETQQLESLNSSLKKTQNYLMQ